MFAQDTTTHKVPQHKSDFNVSLDLIVMVLPKSSILWNADVQGSSKESDKQAQNKSVTQKL